MAGQDDNPSVSKPQRAVFENVLSPEECRELVFILKSCGVVGYRPHVVSCTPMDLIASNSAELVLPLLNAAVRVQQLVEARFERECELFLEFVGLISWQPGARIGWHFDSNREYLKQRHYSAVCYLNDQGADFSGGTFRFRNAEPSSVEPIAGRVVAYSSGEENTHRVDLVTGGERTTLALWFTADPDHSKDGILLPQLQSALHRALSLAPGGKNLASVPYPVDPPDTFFVEPEAWARERQAGFADGRERSEEGEGLGASQALDALDVTDERRAKKRKTSELSGASHTRGARRPRSPRDDDAAAPQGKCFGEGLDSETAAKEEPHGSIGREKVGGSRWGGEDRRVFSERASDGGACRAKGSDGEAGSGSVGEGVAEMGCAPASDEGRIDGAGCLEVERGEEDLRDRRLKELGLRFVNNRLGSLDEEPGPTTGRSAGSHVSDDPADTAEHSCAAGGHPSKVVSKSEERFERCSESASVPTVIAQATGETLRSQRPGVPTIGHSEADADDRRMGPGDERTVRLQWLDGENFEGEFRSKAHALQVLYHFEQCSDAAAQPADAAAPIGNDTRTALPDTGSVEDGSGHGEGSRVDVNRHRLRRSGGRLATDQWERYALSKWHRLQEVLERWSALGIYTGDSLSV